MSDEQSPHQRAEGEGIAQADRGGTAIVNIVNYEHVVPHGVDPAILEEAKRLLDELPLDRVPESSPPFPGSVVPPMDPNPLFRGREEELKALAAEVKADAISAAGPVRTVAITGLGGVGKTQLASEFAHRYGRYFRGGIYWLNLSNPHAAGDEIATCGGAGAMRLRPDFDRLSLENQVREVKSAWQSELPRLLVFDSCEDGNLLRACRPTTGGCRVLVTSRGVLGDPALGVIPLPLEVLSREDSVELLRKHCRDMPIDVGDLDMVAEELGDLPLALDLAGRFLLRYRYAVTPSAYVEELRSPELLDHPSLRQVDGYSPTGHEMDVGRTFLVSYERLDSGDPTDRLAVRLLARSARFAPGEPIDRRLLLSTVDTSEDAPAALQREDALSRLTQLGLLTESEAGSLRMHRLVAAFARREIDDEEAQSAVEQAVGDAALKVSIQGQPVKLTTLLPHLRHVSGASGEREDYPAVLARYAMGISLYALESYDEARPHVERAVRMSTSFRGAMHPRTLRMRNDLAVVIKRQGDLDAALRVYEEVLEDQKRVLGARHHDVASTLLNIGSLLREKGLYHEVLPRYREALGIREEALSKTDPEDPERRQLLRDMGESLHNIGAGLMDLGRHREASPYFERALQIYERNLNEVRHVRYAGTAMVLGSALRAQRDYQRARARLERALEIHRQVLPEGHAETAKNLMNLGALLEEQANRHESLSTTEREETLSSARGHLEEALTLSEELYGSDHSITGGILRVLAGVAHAQGQIEDEGLYRERADTIRGMYFASVDDDTAIELHRGAMALAARGLYEEAMAYQEHSLQLHTEAFGEKSLETAESLFALSRLLLLQGRDEQARPYLEQVLVTREEFRGVDHPATEIVRETLSTLGT